MAAASGYNGTRLAARGVVVVTMNPHGRHPLRSGFGHFDDCLSESLWGLLRQIVPDPALDESVRIFAGELACVSARLRVWGAVRVTFEGNDGHSDCGTLSKPPFDIVIFRLALGQAEPPAVVVNPNGDVVRIVEGRSGAVERGVIEVPLRRCEAPNQLRKVAPVSVVASPAALRGEVI